MESHQIGRLEFKDTEISLLELIKNERDVPFREEIVHCLASEYWHYAFLEAYRIVEAFYPFEKVIEFRDGLGLSCRASEVFDNCIKILNWKPNERSSLKLILGKISNSELLEVFRLLKNFDESLASEGKLEEKVAEYIYDLRNKLVHYSSKRRRVLMETKEGDWQNILYLMTLIIFDSYNAYKTEF